MTCFLYVISDNSQGPVKIGFSKDPNKRVKQLQTGSNVKLSVFYTLSINPKHRIILEKLIHTATSHHKKHGEWFSLTVEDAIAEINFAVIRYSEHLA